MSINQPLVSIYTCVYNGERTIHRVFNSMRKLEYKNIEHVIINDGSTDTTDELIQEYIKNSPCRVKYVKKENGGKHSALNIAWDIAEGYFMIQLDADDELLPHSITYLVEQYFKIPKDLRNQYWCVHGRCITQSGEFIGDKYPEKINNNDWKKAQKLASTCSGEKIGLQKREFLAEFRFPEVKGVSFIPEAIIWNQINKKYGTWYTNEVVRIYYVGEGGNLTDKKKTRKTFGPTAYFFKWKIINEHFYGRSFKNLLYYSLCYFISSKTYRKNNKYLKDIRNHRATLIALAPITFCGSIVCRIIKKIK